MKFNIKKDFPWFKNNPTWTYLDSSATSLKPKSVIDCINNYYSKWCSNPHNSDSSFTWHVNEMIEDVRKKLAKLFNAKSSKQIIFTSGATESLNLIANGLSNSLKKDDEIILTMGEHTSNLLPWMELQNTKGIKIVYANKENEIPTEEQIIKSITSKTKVISFANISNLLGYELDISKIEKLAHKKNKNVIIVVDATQAIPHKKLDVTKSNIDFMVCSGHKMLSGTGIGCVYMKDKYLSSLKPLRLGGGMNNQVSCNKFTYAPSPDKFEGGSPHTAGIISWGTAIDYLNKFGWDKLLKHELELKQYINQELSKLPNVVLVNKEAKYPIVAFNIKGVHSQDLANYLGRKHIIVRGGLSCAKLSDKIMHEPAVVRASFYLYNDKHDVDALVKALKQFKKSDIVSF